MKKPTLIITGIFVIIVSMMMWWFSDTQVIKRQSQQLADSLSIAKTAGKTTRLTKTQKFSGLLSPSVRCQIDIADYRSDYGHDDLQAAHHILVHNCESSSATISEMEITSISDTLATVTADLDLAVIEKSGAQHGESCKVVLTWKKNDTGKWRIESIDITRP